MRFGLDGQVCVITGAASGMGAALAVRMAARGAHLALVDRNAAGLEAVRARIAANGAATGGTTVTAHVADLADAAAIAALAADVLAAHARVSVLVSNAGMALAGPFDDYAPEDFEALMDVNFWAGVRLTRAFMPALKREAAAQIVYVSSVFGIIGVPGNVAYCASKFALKGFAEALRQELAHTNVGVTVVHPGGIDTAIARTARVAAGTDAALAEKGMAQFQKQLRTAPGAAAGRILAGIEGRKWRVLIGADARAIDLLQRLLPVSHGRLIARRAAGMASALTRARA